LAATSQPLASAGRKSIPTVPPIGRDLQDRRAGQPLVREQRRFAEAGLAGLRHHFGRDAGERTEQRLVAAERQRHQRRARLDYLQPEPAGEIIGKAGRAHLRDRRPAGGDH